MKFSNKIKSITLCVFIVYIINALMEITVFHSMSDIIADAITLCRYLCYLLFAIKVVYDIFTEKKISAVVMELVAISGVVVLVTDHMRLGAVILVITAMKNIDISKALKYVMFALSAFFAVVVVLALVGVIPDWQHARGDVIRHALGFHYPTDAYSIFLSIVMLYIYSFRKKLSYIVLGALTIFDGLLFYLTDGRLSFILTTALLLFGFGCKLFSGNKKLTKLFENKKVQTALKVICICLPIVLTLTAFGAVWLYKQDTAIGQKLNSVLSDRLMYSSNAIENYPVEPFGAAVEWFGWGGFGFTETPEDFNYNYVDMSYIRMLFDYGILFSIVIIGAYTLLLKDLCKKREYVTAFIIVVVLLWSFVEPYIFSLARNLFVMMFIPYLEYGSIDLKKIFPKKRKKPLR